jgi:DNA-binding transcriptional LysR family regulator
MEEAAKLAERMLGLAEPPPAAHPDPPPVPRAVPAPEPAAEPAPVAVPPEPPLARRHGAALPTLPGDDCVTPGEDLGSP